MKISRKNITAGYFVGELFGKNATLLLAVVISGYPVAATIVSIIGLESKVITIPFRALVCVFSLAVVLAWITKKQKPAISLPFLLFSILYFIRLLADYVNVNDTDRSFLLLYFASVVFLPAFVLAVVGIEQINEKLLALLVILFGLILTAGVFWGSQLGGNEVDIGATRLALDALNPIALANAAASSVIAAAWLSLSVPTKIWQKIVMAVIILASMYIVILAASRGPLVSLAFAICVLMLTKFKHVLWVGPLAIVGLAIALPGTLLFERFYESTARISNAEQNILIRFEYQKAALEQFTDNPFFGEVATLIAYGPLTYPHNMIIEVMMSLGVIGIFVFILLLVHIARAFLDKKLHAGRTLASLFFVQYFVAAQFSGALWGNGQVWAMIGLFAGHLLVKQVKGRRTNDVNITHITSPAKLTKA